MFLQKHFSNPLSACSCQVTFGRCETGPLCQPPIGSRARSLTKAQKKSGDVLISKTNISVVCQWTQDDTSRFFYSSLSQLLTQPIATTRCARFAGQTIPQPSPSSSTLINSPSLHINSATLPRCLPRASHGPMCFCHPLLPQDSFPNTSDPHRKNCPEIFSWSGRWQGRQVGGLCHPLPLSLHDTRHFMESQTMSRRRARPT